jgi:hypothetical protein
VAVEEFAVDKTDYMSKNIAIATPIIFQQRTTNFQQHDMSQTDNGACAYDFSNTWVNNIHGKVLRLGFRVSGFSLRLF